MNTISKNVVSVAVALALGVGSISPSFASTSMPTPVEAPAMSLPAPIMLGMESGIVPLSSSLTEGDLQLLSSVPALSREEAEATEGGLPLALILALAGAASAMGFYLYGVIVQHKPFVWSEFVKRGGCGAFIGLIGRFFAGRAAVIRILGAGATGAGLARCYSS